MAEDLTFHYDKEGDILDISIGRPKKAVSKEIQEDVFVRMDEKTKEIVGFMIMNFEKRFKTLGHVERLPIRAIFELKEKATA